MGRVNGLLLVLILGGGGYLFLQNFEVEGLQQLRLRPRNGEGAGSGFGGFGRGTRVSASGPAAAGPGETIRIATFNIQVFGRSKVQKLPVMDKLANICRRFDVTAIQEIRSSDQDILPQLVARINSSYGGQFDYVIGPRIGRTSQLEQYAYVFNAATVEVDRKWLYTVSDPDDLLHREPLVASFRARGAPPEHAFTFTLINIHTDPDEATEEIAVLDDVFRVVRGDGRNEDDIILLGDLNADDSSYGELSQMAGMTWAVAGTPTNTRGTNQLDNILFTRQATREYMGRSGVFDFMREFNLTLQEALEISDHLPVWAEFSVLEGGIPGRVAP